MRTIVGVRFLASFLIMVALFTSLPIRSQPGPTPLPFHWEPEELVLTLGPNQGKTVKATLVADRDLPPVSAQISSNISQWVTVSPSVYFATPEGGRRTFTISFNIGPDPPLETRNAYLKLVRATVEDEHRDRRNLLRIRGGDTPMPTYELQDFPLPIKLNIWQETNNQYYSVHYPAGLIFESDTSANVFTRGPATSHEEPALQMSIDLNPDGLILEQYYDGDPGRNLLGQTDEPTSEVILDGIISLKFRPSVTFAGESVIIVPLNNAFIRIVDEGQSFETDGILQPILDSIEINGS